MGLPGCAGNLYLVLHCAIFQYGNYPSARGCHWINADFSWYTGLFLFEKKAKQLKRFLCGTIELALL